MSDASYWVIWHHRRGSAVHAIDPDSGSEQRPMIVSWELMQSGATTGGLVALMGFLNGRPEFLDIGVVYALINFIATIAVLKYIEYRRLG